MMKSDRSERDPRLDVFRGVCMCIILFAHMRWSVVSDWIPARFGLSDAAEMFVFLSGCASAIAFGGTFRRAGFLIGSARILYRCWQLYLCHLMVFFAVAALAAGANAWFASPDYVEIAYLSWFFAEPARAMLHLFGLAYVPAFLDIIPVYMVVLAMVPAMMALSRLNPLLPMAASVLVYVLANASGWNFPADPLDGRGWFLNPFAWQLVFFAGFGLSMGWIRAPGPSRSLLAVSAAVLAIGLLVKVSWAGMLFPPVKALATLILDHSDKTFLDPMRLAHFFAVAYIVHGVFAANLGPLRHRLLAPIRKVGQQALPSFLLGIVLSQLGGLAFDQIGAGWSMQVLVNSAALAVMIGAAYVVGWFKSSPWRRPTPERAAGPAEAVRPFVAATASR
jgi:hypothetical protein